MYTNVIISLSVAIRPKGEISSLRSRKTLLTFFSQVHITKMVCIYYECPVLLDICHEVHKKVVFKSVIFTEQTIS